MEAAPQKKNLLKNLNKIEDKRNKKQSYLWHKRRPKDEEGFEYVDHIA